MSYESIPTTMFTLRRVVQDNGAWGTIWFNEGQEPVPFAVTLERTYEGTFKQIKVPDGLWLCTRRKYNRGNYMTWEIHVPGHRYILFHKGNKELQSDGCILIAEQFFDFDSDPGLQSPGVGRSGDAFKEFMQLSEGVDRFFLEVMTIGG